MVGEAVNNMDRIEEIVPALQAMGKRHVEYGVEDEQYPIVGEVLLGTLATALGDAQGRAAVHFMASRAL